MKKIVCLATLLLFCLGCKETKVEYSETFFEDATIVTTVYTPPFHDTELTPTIDFEGNITFSYDEIDIPEKFVIVFRCKHGEFIIERRELYDRFKGYENQAVRVKYREVYEVIYEKQNGETKKIHTTLVKYDFLDATLKNK